MTIFFPFIQFDYASFGTFEMTTTYGKGQKRTSKKPSSKLKIAVIFTLRTTLNKNSMESSLCDIRLETSVFTLYQRR
jgi:hypothetical protein